MSTGRADIALGRQACYATEMSTSETEFRRWREAMGFSQATAAEALGVSVSQVKNWDSGVDRGKGVRAVPSVATRTLMSALHRGLEITPWPAEPEKPKRKRG